MNFKKITSVLFDTSFLLNDSPEIDRIINTLRRDDVACYISATVQSELEYLYYMGQISLNRFKRATARYKRAHSENIESTRNYLYKSMVKECTISMNEEHGTSTKDIRNDCNILTTSLNNHISLILSEDFHFTSKYTDRVVDNICNATCDRFKKLCECDTAILNKDSFLKTYREQQVNLDMLKVLKPEVRKSTKSLKER